MKSIFVFTAGTSEARSHLSASITSPIDPDVARVAARSETQPVLSDVLGKVGALYAWGAEPGPQNVNTWGQMKPGDHVLCVYDNAYRFSTEVVAKVQDEALAQGVWGWNDASGGTREYMYFLTPPRPINRPVEELADVLPKGYRGFTQIADHCVAEIEASHGGLDTFLEGRLMATERKEQPDELFRILRIYQSEGVVFESSTRGRRYRVVSAAPTSARIERVDGGEPESVTADGYAQVRARLTGSGQLTLAEVPGNRLQGATFAQATAVGLAADRKTLVDIEADERAAEFFGDHIRSLRVDRSGGAPRLYKPVVLDVVLHGIASGDLARNHISFDWLLPRFLRRISELGQEAEEKTAAYAFANLAGDVIWLLAYRDGAPPIDSSSPSPGMVRGRISHARLKDRLWQLLQDPRQRDALHQILRRAWLEPKEAEPMIGLHDGLEAALEGYVPAKREPFSGEHPMFKLFQSVKATVEGHSSVKGDSDLEVVASVGRGNWAAVPWVAVLGEGQQAEDGVYCVYLFRKDMTGVYATFNQGVTKVIREHGSRDGRSVLESRAERLRRFCQDLPTLGFSFGADIDLRVSAGLGRNYESSTIAHKFYPTGGVPDDEALGKDLEALVKAYQNFLESSDAAETSEGGDPGSIPEPDFNIADGIEAVIEYIEARGFSYEPWHIAQYVTAIRTKPFTILAGITGTGKSKLPALVADATGSECVLVPVRPDWTDSSDVLGYLDLQGTFRPGRLLEVFREAMNQDDRHFVCIVDEMNLARVEQYFAEILSNIEDRRQREAGGFASGALVSQALGKDDEEWAGVCLPSNLALVGTVNMDESAHGFSRKVLDRAFTLELSDVDLANWRGGADAPAMRPIVWPTSAWHPRAIMLGRLGGLTDEEAVLIDSVVGQLMQLNVILRQAQLQLGYRSRDEIALFVLHARDVAEAFRDRDGNDVDPLDLAIQMKVLPRIIGGSNGIRGVLAGLLGWAYDGGPKNEDDASELVSVWEETGRADKLVDSRFPRSAARLCLMWKRLQDEGFTSFWL